MRIDAGLDTGDILMQREFRLVRRHSRDAGPEAGVHRRGSDGRDAARTRDGQVRPTPQDHSQATLAPILKKEDGRMDFARTAKSCSTAAWFSAVAGAFTIFKGKRCKCTALNPATCGCVDAREIAVEGTRLFVGCGKNEPKPKTPTTALELLEVQLEGKRRMTAQEFINGYRPQSGDHLGQ
jgi:methionyl-tRNA formyltransferase